MDRIAFRGRKVRPNYSLLKFARECLLSKAQWEELDKIGDPAKPSDKTILVDGYPRQIWEKPSPAYRRKGELEAALVEQFREEIASGRWAVTAIPAGAHTRETIAIELIEHAKDISFIHSRIGRFNRVEIVESPSSDRYLVIKWFIEQVCETIRPKQGIGKAEILDLADKLLDFDVREDIFKAAWADARIPEGFRKPGR